MLERVDEHLLDLVVCESVGRFHFDRLLDVGPQFGRRDAENAVGVDLKLHLDARHARGHGRDAPQPKTRQGAVVGHQFPFALEHVNVDRRLVVHAAREHLAARRWNRGVAQNDLRHHAAHGLDTE